MIAPVSAISLRETGIFRNTAGDFPRFQLRVVDSGEAGDYLKCAKSPDFRACASQVVDLGKLLDWVAAMERIELDCKMAFEKSNEFRLICLGSGFGDFRPIEQENLECRRCRLP